MPLTPAARIEEAVTRRESATKYHSSQGRWKDRLNIAACLSLSSYIFCLLISARGNPPFLSWRSHPAEVIVISLIALGVSRLFSSKTCDWRFLLIQFVLTAAAFQLLGDDHLATILVLTPMLMDCFAYLHPLAAIFVGMAGISAMALSARGMTVAISYAGWLTPVMGAIIGWMAAGKTRLRMQMKGLEEQFKHTTAEFAEANLRLQEYANQAEFFSAMEERNRLAREIHDTLGHLLISMMVQIRACKTAILSRPEEVGAELGVLEDAVQNGLNEVREAVATLRQPRGGPRGRQLWSKMASIFSDTTHMNVDMEIADDFLGLEEEVELTTYRIIQEGLTNAYRHGHAKRCRIRIWEYDGFLVIHISDNGDGASKIEEGFGLRGMRERVEALGGEIAYRYQLGCGFDIGAQLPLRGGEHNG